MKLSGLLILSGLVSQLLLPVFTSANQTLTFPCTASASEFGLRFGVTFSSDPNPCGGSGGGYNEGSIGVEWDDPDPGTPGVFRVLHPNHHLGGPLVDTWTTSTRLGIVTSNPMCPVDIQNIIAAWAPVVRVWKYTTINGDILNDSGECGSVSWPPYCGAPAGWLGETAYVIVGDLTPDPSVRPSEAAEGIASMQRAADAAIQRLRSMGYTVEPRGTTSQPASRSDVENALKDPQASAVWLLAHNVCDRTGPSPLSCTAQAKSGFRFRVADDADGNPQTITDLEVKNWRTGGRPLRELNFLICDAAQAPDNAGTWRVEDGVVIHAPSQKLLWRVPEKLEEHFACSTPQTLDAFLQTRRSFVNEAGDAFVPMLLRTDDGRFGDDVYGTSAGAWLRLGVDASGTAMCFDSATAVSVRLDGRAPGDSVTVWMNRYTSTPTDTVPSGEKSVAAFVIDCDPPGQGVVTLGYDQTLLDSLGVPATTLRAWHFEDPLGAHVAVPFVLDTIRHSVQLDPGNLGNFLLTVPAPLTAVLSSLPKVEQVLPPAPNPTRGRVNLRLELSAPALVRANVYDVAGRLVRQVAEASLGAGVHILSWDGTDGAGRALPGVYFYRVTVDGRRFERAIVMVR